VFLLKLLNLKVADPVLTELEISQVKNCIFHIFAEFIIISIISIIIIGKFNRQETEVKEQTITCLTKKTR
jgi:hypothetical protein